VQFYTLPNALNPLTMKNTLIVCLLLCFGMAISQEATFTSEEISITVLTEGTLLIPDTEGETPLVIIIAGSGPTDRDGNQIMTKNNSLKYLAEGLYKKSIASFRYDKRILKIMKMGQIDEKKIDFNHFIEDASAILLHFKNDSRFSQLFILGHSQGSLVGMVVAQDGADGFISVAGAGQSIDNVIVDQLALQAPGLKDNARENFDDLRANGVAKNYSPGLASIFRPAIQPFMYTWMQYDPKVEIAKLDMPVLIINGDKDLQVQVAEAESLQKAVPGAQLEIIENMNHIFKEIEGGGIENSKSYNEYATPVSPKLIEVISTFILKE